MDWKGNKRMRKVILVEFDVNNIDMVKFYCVFDS